jgi:hypothetical protein
VRGLLGLLLVLAGPAAAQVAGPLPCVPPPATDRTPWVTRARILHSFPADSPLPRFVGGFGDSVAGYELHLWSDKQGLFGELLHPVLDADSPTSRLSAVAFDSSTGTLIFRARFGTDDRQFEGTLEADVVSGRFDRSAPGEVVTLKRLPPERIHGAAEGSYTSRAQFECAMTLFHR